MTAVQRAASLHSFNAGPGRSESVRDARLAGFALTHPAVPSGDVSGQIGHEQMGGENRNRKRSPF